MHRLCRARTFVYCLRELRCLKFQNQCHKHCHFLAIDLLFLFHTHRLQGNCRNKILCEPLLKNCSHNQLEGILMVIIKTDIPVFIVLSFGISNEISQTCFDRCCITDGKRCCFIGHGRTRLRRA